MNGYGVSNYDITPKGFDHVDALVSGRLCWEHPRFPQTLERVGAKTHLQVRALYRRLQRAGVLCEW